MAINKKIPSPQEVKSSPFSFKQEELTQLKELRTKVSQLTLDLGNLMINKIKLEESENLLKKTLSDLENKLTKKYGKGSIDLDSGTFTPMD